MRQPEHGRFLDSHRLSAKIKELREPKAKVGTFADGRLKYEAETKHDVTLGPLSKDYRARCVECLLKTWRGLDKIKVDEITEADCTKWHSRYAEQYLSQVVNNTVNVLRRILTLAGLGRDANPAFKIKRLGIPRNQLDLPTADQFNQILTEIETAGAVDAKDRADFVRFLAFSGCRLSEAVQAKWQDVNLEKNEMTIHRHKRRSTSNESQTRIIPLAPAMRHFLAKPHNERQPKSGDTICRVFVCKKPTRSGLQARRLRSPDTSFIAAYIRHILH